MWMLSEKLILKEIYKKYINDSLYKPYNPQDMYHNKQTINAIRIFVSQDYKIKYGCEMEMWAYLLSEGN